MDTEKPRCCVIMPSKFMWSNGSRCTRKAKVERDGKHYCGVHDPVRLKTAQNERDAIYREQSRERQRIYRLQNAAPDLLEALEQLLNQFDSEIHNEYDGTGMLNDRLSEANHARRVIAKAKGETK